MYISKFSIHNYKCFDNTDIVQFSPGINIIVGKNNSGKTALLEALNLNFKNASHQSLKILPDDHSKVKNGISSIRITLSLRHQEFYNLIDQISKPLAIPLLSYPELSKEYQEDKESLDIREADFEIDNEYLHRKEVLETLEKFNEILNGYQEDSKQMNLALYVANSELWLKSDEDDKKCNFDMYLPSSEYQKGQKYYWFVKIEQKIDSSFKPIPVDHEDYDRYEIFKANYNQFIGSKIFDLYKNRIYRFYAQRPQVGNCPYGDSNELKPDASNLAEVLSCLQPKRQRFIEFNKYVNRIFPQIKGITVVNRKESVEILVWNIDPDTEREDLALPLESCGTGISQVLAILYILVTSKDSRTIIIDEPQSFLHPGATRDLMDILELFPQHQYFIATHSPAIISTSEAYNIIQLKYDEEEYKTIISSVGSQNMYSLLNEIGAQLSDVFGYDRILWVEGQTEETCFPLILEKVAKEKLRGTKILCVHSTGDLLDRKNSKLIKTLFSLYKKVFGQESLIPPAVGFIFDKEGKNDDQCRKLNEISDNSITWLKRRMYENYILYPEAVAYVINQELQGLQLGEETGESLQELTNSEKIKQWFYDKIQQEYQTKNKKYFPNWESSKINDQTWLYQNIHAGKILEDLFYDEYKIPYAKTKHSVAITNWILEKDQNHLTELINIIKSVFKPK